MITADIITTHTVADWLIDTIHGILNKLGLENHQFIEEAIYIAVITIFSILIGMCIKKIVLAITHTIMRHRKTELATELINQKVFVKCSHVIPALVFLAFIPFAFKPESITLRWITRFGIVYALIAVAVGTNAVLKFCFDTYNARKNRKNLPIRGILNVAIGLVWIIIGILSVCVIIDKSPATLLAGLGAFAAALLLIFKDSILGFVAGIQMSDNDMVHVGDWIVVPGTPANGNVIDVSLSTVKILNWDLTTVMVPPFTLVSTSFQNYRSMYDAGARRIMNSFTIQIQSIKNLTSESIQNIVAKYPVLKDFVDGLQQKGATAATIPDQRGINGTIETNLGLFRAYVTLYLCNNPGISKDQRVMVRLMEGTNAGIPLQIWCFTASTNWDEYESVLSEVMEHIAAAAPDFDGLTLYSANDVSIENYSDKLITMQPGTNPAGSPTTAA